MQLRTKISSIAILTLFVFTFVIGIYFDAFLENDYYDKNENKITRALQRVIVDLKTTEASLKEGIGFVQHDISFIASMELINNYQDKNHYNAILLDEEKKIIAKNLLDRVKISLNDSIAVYDKNAELVAFVYKDGAIYKLNFISYEDGKRVLYSKCEADSHYKKSVYKEKSQTPFHHTMLYTQKELHQGKLVTYQFRHKQLHLTSHISIFDTKNPMQMKMYMEMSKVFSTQYFNKISDDLDLKVSLTSEVNAQKKPSPLFDFRAEKRVRLIDIQSHYISVFSIQTVNGEVYIKFALDKENLNRVLKKNRYQLILFMIVAIVVILLLFNFLMRFGLMRPLEKLMHQIRQIKNGDYSASPVVKTEDELEEISENINMLATAVESREVSLRESQKKLEYFATHDELTRLINRRAFSIELKHALQKALRNKTQVAVLFLDLDEFKQVNDTLGHSIGDILLQSVANRLQESLRESDVLARVGGDEFNIFIEGFKYISEVQVLAQKILDAFIEPFVDDENEIVSSTSIGIALFPDDGKDTETLTKNADLAMYKSKERGGNSYSFYSSKFSESVEHRMEIVQALKSAVKNEQEFLLYYQPKISIKTKKIVGVEALIRWNSPELGFVRPDEFIHIAEETHMIIDIGRWVLKQACSDFVSLKEKANVLEQISVNVSGVQLEYSDMFETVKEITKLTHMDVTKLEIEVTESYIATNEVKAIKTLSKFRSMGIELAIDDFGTGYSSMSYLQSLPISRLKIDKAFVDDLPSSKESVAVVSAIIALAEAFHLKITVEGVEKVEQVAFFEDKYCDDIQGYYYSKPLTFSDFKEFLSKHS